MEPVEIQELCRYRLDKARDELSTSTILLGHKKFSQSINRSYYAVFQATRALLALDRFDSKKHSSIISYFGKQYIASGRIPHIYHEILTGAFKIRNLSDYDDYYVATKEEAENQNRQAEQFVDFIGSYINNIL